MALGTTLGVADRFMNTLFGLDFLEFGGPKWVQGMLCCPISRDEHEYLAAFRMKVSQIALKCACFHSFGPPGATMTFRKHFSNRVGVKMNAPVKHIVYRMSEAGLCDVTHPPLLHLPQMCTAMNLEGDRF